MLIALERSQDKRFTKHNNEDVCFDTRVNYFFTLYIKNTFSGEVSGSCLLFSSHFSCAWNEMKNQLLTL